MIRIPQLPGDLGIKQIVSLMKAYVNQSIDDPLIRAQAVRATTPCGNYDIHCKSVALGEWVRAHVRYVPDPLGREQLTHPTLMARAVHEGRVAYGDCDDMSMYVAAMAKSIGLAPAFLVTGRNESFHHVYVSIRGIIVDPSIAFGKHPFTPRRAAILVI